MLRLGSCNIKENDKSTTSKSFSVVVVVVVVVARKLVIAIRTSYVYVDGEDKEKCHELWSLFTKKDPFGPLDLFFGL